MEELNAEVQDYSAEKKNNGSEKMVNKYLVAVPPTTESSFEIGEVSTHNNLHRENMECF